jgi:ABC-type bacteriocin/lantibiotic exporter with double-glycine peptidase domain
MTIVQLVPKYFIEILLGSFLFIFGFYMISKNLQTVEESIQISEIVFFLVGFQRIAATASSISTLVAKNYKRLPSLNLVNTYVHKKIDTNISNYISVTNPGVNTCEELIRMENVSFKVDEISILNDISFEIKQNSFTFIYGKSGSGKSTLAKIISGNLAPTSGNILYSNNESPNDQKSIIGYIPQEPKLFSGTIKENIYLNIDVDNSDLANIDFVLEVCGLNKILNKLPKGIDTMIDSSSEFLSVGQKCRVAIARLLIRKPSLIIFDESLDRLESKSAESILLNIREKTNSSIIVVTHRTINTALTSNQFRIESGKISKI